MATDSSTEPKYCLPNWDHDEWTPYASPTDTTPAEAYLLDAAWLVVAAGIGFVAGLIAGA